MSNVVSKCLNILLMQFPSLEEIDQIRNSGFRPQIVGCFLNNKKILFLYKKNHDLWQLPQGGIDNGEDEMTFPNHSQNSRDLKNDAGEKIFMKGKKYFFIAADSNAMDLNIGETEFDAFKWVSFDESFILCNNIYQVGKKRITLNVLDQLKNSDKII
jgi:hypothetical protein